MAIATATALALAGAASAAATTTMSFIQAGEQKNAQRKAEDAAAAAMAEAKKKLEVNVYDKLSIQKEPYELQREELLSQGAQAIQAGVESERGSAPTAGMIQMAQNKAQAGVRSAMGQELMGLQQLSAQEEARMRDMGLSLDLQEATGAQLAARDAEKLAAQATQQGFAGVTSLGQELVKLAPLFEKSDNDSGIPLPPQPQQTIQTQGYAGPMQAPTTLGANMVPLNPASLMYNYPQQTIRMQPNLYSRQAPTALSQNINPFDFGF